MINYKDRTYGKTKDIAFETLKKLFQDSKFDYLSIVLLFGSRARGDATAQSDYDFAIVGETTQAPFGVQAKSWIEISMAMEVSECDIDVVDLSRADTLMKSSIAEKYIVLKGDEGEISRLLA